MKIIRNVLSFIVLIVFSHPSFAQTNADEEHFNARLNAALQGDTEAMCDAADCYFNGKGAVQSYEKAVEWYEKAAEQGNARGEWRMGYCYYWGKGLSESNRKAVKWFEKSAAKGYAEGMNDLGIMYQAGHGVTQSYEKAFQWFWEAAEKGHLDSQHKIGYYYSNGYGVPKNYEKAVEWYKKAAERGYAPSQYNLGLRYERGEGVPQDYAKAAEWYEKAAVQGDKDAQNNLGWAYQNGRGVPQDYEKALEWYRKAAAQGEKKAKNNLANLEKKMIIPTQDYPNALQTAQNVQTVSTAPAQVAAAPVVVQQPQEASKSDVDLNIPETTVNNENTFAVIIGNEDYQRVSKVDHALNDAKMFAIYCQKVLGLPESNVRCYENATYGSMETAIDDIKAIAKAYNGNLSVIFYYAGHGIPDEASRSAFLLPVDVDGSQTRLCMSVDNLYKNLSSLKARRVTVFMDACFSGSQRGEGMLAAARGIALKAKQNAPQGNMVVFSAATGDETAYPYKEKHHGLFTYYLLKKLQETKGEVTLGELSDFVQTQVERKSVVINRKSQTPTLMPATGVGTAWRSWKLR